MTDKRIQKADRQTDRQTESDRQIKYHKYKHNDGYTKILHDPD